MSFFSGSSPSFASGSVGGGLRGGLRALVVVEDVGVAVWVGAREFRAPMDGSVTAPGG